MAYEEVGPPKPKGITFFRMDQARSSEAVLLLAPLGSTRLEWYKQVAVFGGRFRTIALDHRDSGDSDTVSATYTIGDMADDAAAVLGALDISSASVVGTSLGGFVALQLALSYPHLVDKLVVTSTAAIGRAHVPRSDVLLAQSSMKRGKEVGEQVRKTYSKLMAHGYAQRHPEDLDRLAEIARHRPRTVEAYFRQVQAAMTFDVSQQLHHIQSPTLVIHGTHDPLIRPTNGRYLARHIPRATLLLYTNVGHVPIIECADVFNRDVLAFLTYATPNVTFWRQASVAE